MSSPDLEHTMDLGNIYNWSSAKYRVILSLQYSHAVLFSYSVSKSHGSRMGFDFIFLRTCIENNFRFSVFIQSISKAMLKRQIIQLLQNQVNRAPVQYHSIILQEFWLIHKVLEQDKIFHHLSLSSLYCKA